MKKSLFVTRLIVSFCISLITLGLTTFIVEAKDLELTYNNEYFLENTDSIRVINTHVIKNNSEDTILRKENTEVFVITHLKSNLDTLKSSVDTIKVTAEGKTLPFEIEYQGDYAFVKVEYPRKVLNNDSLVILLEYQNFGLLEKAGMLYDIYIPGVPKDTEFELENQTIKLNTTVYINDAIFPEENFVLPKPSAETLLDNGYKKYFFDSETILGKTIWIQRGLKQFYQFKLTQKFTPTMGNDIGLRNEYALVLPRDVDNLEIYQKVYFDQIQPLPDWIEKDADGNLIAYFKIPSSLSGEIVVTGIVEVGITGDVLDEASSGSLADYDITALDYALGSAEYWEVDSLEIKKEASELLGNKTNVYQILDNTFDFVTDSIDYSDIKRLGINQRQGALRTLQNGSGVCMEYADLFLALARAQGIPTRAVFGYGFDPREESSSQQTHQWVTSYIPKLNKWYDLDVTWGDSGQVAEGGNLNHFYTHIVSSGPNALPDVSVNIFGTKDEVSLPQYEITAKSEEPNIVNMTTQEDLINNYPKLQAVSVSDAILQIPLKIGAYFSNIPNKDALSIVLFTLGFCLIIVPIVLLKRKYISVN